jgi:serine phosphatase RsbU (regulator of sigma subunit)
MYTDGATEIRNAANAELGAEGLMKLVRENVSAGVDGRLDIARLEEQLLQYGARIRFADDLTLLAAYYLK